MGDVIRCQRCTGPVTYTVKKFTCRCRDLPTVRADELPTLAMAASELLDRAAMNTVRVKSVETDGTV